MNKTVASIAFLLVLAIVCAGVFWAVLHSQEVAVATRTRTFVSLVGQKAPDLRVLTNQHQSFVLSQTHRPLVLEVFATWCEYCQAEVKTMNQLYAKYGNSVNFLAVTGSAKGMDDVVPESWSDIQRFTKKFRVKYPIGFDPQPHQIARDYRAAGYPDIAVIGSDGIVTFHAIGATLFGPLDAALSAVASACSKASKSCGDR